LKTKNKKKWFKPEVTDTGWDKDLPADTRRALMLKAHGGDELAAARAVQALSNITKDRETRKDAQADADYFYQAYREGKTLVPYPASVPHHNGYKPSKKVPEKRTAMRVTPRTVRISRRPPRISKPMPKLR